MPVALDSAAGVAAAFALALVPGLALLRAAGAGPADPLARAGVAAGLGLAAVPVVVLWLATVGVPVGPWTWWAVLAAGGMAVAWPGGRWGRRTDDIATANADQEAPAAAWPMRRGTACRAHPSAAASASACIALALVLAVQLAGRWAAARGVAIPLWADSVHHTMIVRLFELHDGLPRDWRPLAPLATFSYHFGFHAVTAAVADLTGLPAPRAVVVAGQALMVLQALTVAGLATVLTGRRWAGVAAAVVVGGLGPMPGTYLTWGRYTQLAGQVVLPSAVALAVLAAAPRPSALRHDADADGAPGAAAGDGRAAPLRRALGPIAVAALAVAGLALTHYVVTVFFVAAVGAWWVVMGGGARGRDAGPDSGPDGGPDGDAGGRRDGRARLTARTHAAARLTAVAGLAFALALPWLPRFLAGQVDQSAVALATTTLPDGAVWGAVSLAYVADHFGAWVGGALSAATIVAVAAGLARRDGTVAVAALWIAGLVAASYPRAFGLPITGPLKDFTVLIGLYVPAAVAIGAVAGRVVDDLIGAASTAAPPVDGDGPRRRDRTATAAVGAVVCAAAAAALLAVRQRDVVAPDRVIATPADAAALAWVRDHTPPDAVFLASGQPTYGDTVVLGEDGGWWLPVLAGRACTIPPLTIGHERTVEPGYRQRTVDLAKAVAADLAAADTEARLRREGVGWAYVGPTATTLTAAALAAAGWRVLYDLDGASVWAAPWTAAR